MYSSDGETKRSVEYLKLSQIFHNFVIIVVQKDPKLYNIAKEQ